MDYLEHAASICREKNLRFTEIRRTVLKIITREQKPVKAYDILDEFEQLEKKNQKVGVAKPPTVYRALDFLLENRFIHRLNTLNAFIGCTHPSKHPECFFVICSKCNTVEEYCSKNISTAVEQVGKDRGFQLKRTVVEMEGVCKDCLTKNQQSSPSTVR